MELAIGMSGRARSGKSITARFLAVQYDAVYAPFAGALKGGASYLLGLNAFFPSWDLNIRRFLQVAGTDRGRSMDEDLWLKVWLAIFGGCDRVVVPDVRFPNEVDVIHQLGGVVVFIGEREVRVGAHESEQLDPSLCDAQITGIFDPYYERQKLFQKVLDELIKLGLTPKPRKPKIYTGGRILGNKAFSSVFNDAISAVESAGMSALSPIDSEELLDKFPSMQFREFAMEIAKKDYALISEADGGLFILDEPSVGASMEILALSLAEKPVAVLATDAMCYHPFLHAHSKVFWSGFSGIESAVKWLKSMLTLT